MLNLFPFAPLCTRSNGRHYIRNAGIQGNTHICFTAVCWKTHFENIAPKSVKVKVTPHHGGQAYVTPIDSIGYKAASKAYEDTFGKTPIPQRSGGSIPIVALFEKELKSKTILMGFGLDSDAIHSPNEHFGLFNYYKGIETIPLFYKYFTELKMK